MIKYIVDALAGNKTGRIERAFGKKCESVGRKSSFFQHTGKMFVNLSDYKAK